MMGYKPRKQRPVDKCRQNTRCTDSKHTKKDTPMTHNLAALTPDERQAIEQHRAECLERYKKANEYAKEILLGMRARRGPYGRDWAVSMLNARPEIYEQTRSALNALIKPNRNTS